MGNACSDDTRSGDAGSFRTNHRPRRDYNISYDPANIKNDPDIVSMDPYVWTQNTKNELKFGETRNIAFDPRLKSNTGMDLSMYPHGVFHPKRNDNIDEPTPQIAKTGAAFTPSQLALDHQRLLGAFSTNPDPTTVNNKNFGPYVYSNGNSYKGQYKLGQRSGFGTEVNSRGDIYEGQWINDMKLGKGRLILSNGDMF